MPSSIVLYLQAIEDGVIRGQTGRAIHGLWFDHLPPAIASSFHGISPAPFSLSPLMGVSALKGGWLSIAKGDIAWFRVAMLEDEHGNAILDAWSANLPREIELAGIRWQLISLQRDMLWQKTQSYRELADLPLPQKMSFKFLTPVTFNSGKSLGDKTNYLPFPLPDSLFKSWHKRWNAFAPPALRISKDLPSWARQALVVSYYRLKTVPVRHGKRVHIGCVGEYALRFVDCPVNIKKYFGWLARYAFYCGSGAKTTQGMGMTRLIE